MSYQDFTKMSVWQRGFELLLEIYKITKSFPSDERFGLTSDIRRAANSIVHNVAEGFGRFEAKSVFLKCHALREAVGSLRESPPDGPKS
jgi:four helix bundle protein